MVILTLYMDGRFAADLKLYLKRQGPDCGRSAKLLCIFLFNPKTSIS
jgi:hypothetical protein